MERNDREDLNKFVLLFEVYLKFWMGRYSFRVIINSYKHNAMIFLLDVFYGGPVCCF